MKKRRVELFLKARQGQIFARVFAQLDTEKSSIALRARVNSGSKFVDTQEENYRIGVYSSLSPSFPNPDFPWWVQMDAHRAQIIISEERIRNLVTNDNRYGTFKRYFAGRYQTPKDVLEMLVATEISDHYVPKALAGNVAAPRNVLELLVKHSAAWQSNKVSAILSMPDDVRQFLTEPE